MQVRMPKLVESHLGSMNTEHKRKLVNGVYKFLEPIDLVLQLDRSEFNCEIVLIHNVSLK